MVLHWAECVCHAFAETGDFSKKRLAWRVTFSDDAIPTYEDKVPSLESIRNLVDFSVDLTNGLINIEVRKGFLAACRRSDNAAEAEIVRALIASAYEFASTDATQVDIDRMSQTVVSDIGARHFHVLSTHDIRDYVRGNLPEHGQIIANWDDTESRIGLGWMVRERSAGEMIGGKEECCKYLSDLVRGIGNQMRQFLAMLNRTETIEALLINHEALFAESDHWMRTFRAVRAISDDPQDALQRASMKLATFNAGMLASRILIEMALCECPVEGGSKPGVRDLGQLMANASQMFHYGGYSDAMNVGIMKPVIRISPAGDVLMEHDFTDETVRPLGEKYQEVSLSHAAEKYQGNYADADEVAEENSGEETASPAVEGDFANAWKDEYGFSLEETEKVGEFFKIQAVETQQPVLKVKKSELLSHIEKETSLSSKTIGAVLAAFTLQPRLKWDEAPVSYLPSAWHPWRFRRQLSLVSKFIVQLDTSDDPTCMIASAMIVHHLSKFISDALYGRFDEALFHKNGLLAKWIGHTTHERGKGFNERVAKRFRDNGWHAEANLSDGRILNRQKDPRFGDVDVLAWQPESGRVLLSSARICR